MHTGPPKMIALNDLLRQSSALKEQLAASIKRVLESGWYILGRECAAFEEEFAAYCGVGHCVSVANGTEALELALRCLGVRVGDSVATVANAGGYSTTAIRAIGGEPLYVDIDADTMNMSAASLAERLRPGVRAVIATHLYGRMADLPALEAVTRKLGVPLVEDCAQAHGAAIGGRKAGSWGEMACFSFYPTKNLGALGDGGAITTRDAGLAQRVRRLRQYGWSSKYQCAEYGRNSRLDEMQAAILRTKLPYLDGWNARRREIAATYSAALTGSAKIPGGCGPLAYGCDSDGHVSEEHVSSNLARRTPISAGQVVSCPTGFGEDYVAHLYVIRTRAREQMRATLKAAGIGTDIHYPVPDHWQEAARGSADAIDLPITEQAASEVLTLPCYAELEQWEIAGVAGALERLAQEAPVG